VHTDPTAQQASDDPETVVTRIPALDGIRAIGIVLVHFFHGGFGWAGGGFFGVDVFFVLSGFLITAQLVSEFRRHSGIGLKRSWVHRLRRLVPALLAVLAAVAVYGAFFAPPDVESQV
jgi:peptidoglycan/LPS O-acetylase OafA/YrhL